jgi:hypothetical protein
VLTLVLLIQKYLILENKHSSYKEFAVKVKHKIDYQRELFGEELLIRSQAKNILKNKDRHFKTCFQLKNLIRGKQDRFVLFVDDV